MLSCPILFYTLYLGIFFFIVSFSCLFTFLYVSSIAQNTTVTTQAILNPQPVFFGGGIVLGGGSGSFQIGLNPEMAKSYNQYIDLGKIQKAMAYHPEGSRSVDWTSGIYCRIQILLRRSRVRTQQVLPSP